MKYIPYIGSALLGALILYWFFWPQITEKTIIKEVTKIDTVIVEIRDTIYLTKDQIKHVYLRDTIIQNYRPEIRAYYSQTPILYGNINITGKVLGEVLDMDITTDLKIPTITKTVTRTEQKTVIKKPRGLYLSGYINTELVPSVGGLYQDDQFIFSYQFQPSSKAHQIGISKRIF